MQYVLLCKLIEEEIRIKEVKRPRVLHDFLEYLSLHKYSERTIKGYNSDLMLFFEFIKKYLDLQIPIKDFNIFILGAIEEETIISFLVFLNYYNDNIASTRKRKLSSIKTFYKWLFKLYHFEFKDKINPAKDIPSIVQIEKIPKYINLEQAKRLQNIFNITNSKNPIRNNTIITVFLNTGIRISELVNLNISDIDFYNKSAKIIAKGNQERIIFFNNHTIEKIKEYLSIRKDNNDALFISNRNRRICVVSVENICKKAFELIGVDNKKLSAHSLRHSAAIIMYQNTKDILLVKEFLGHKSVSTTQIYTKAHSDCIKDAVDRHPLNIF